MFQKRLFGLIAIFLAVFIVTMALGVNSTVATADIEIDLCDGPSPPPSCREVSSVPPPPPPPSDPTWKPDDRLNPDMAAPAALYAKDGMFIVVDVETGQTILNIAAADLVCPVDDEIVVATAMNGKYTVICYDGGFSVIVDKGDERVIYLFDGVPPTTMITRTYNADGNLTGEKTRFF